MSVSIENTSHAKKEIDRTNHKRKREVTRQERPCTSGFNSSILLSLQRKKNTEVNYQASDWSGNDDGDWNGNENFQPKEVVGGKKCKVDVHSATDKSCTLADRRMTSIRQQ